MKWLTAVQKKAASTEGEMDLAYKPSIADILTICNDEVHRSWQNEWDKFTRAKAKTYAQICTKVNRKPWFSNFYIPRVYISTITRMRFNHCLTAQHLNKINIKESPNCACGEVEDLDHMFFGCLINKQKSVELYKNLIKTTLQPPLNIASILANLDLQRIRLIIDFLHEIKRKL